MEKDIASSHHMRSQEKYYWRCVSEWVEKVEAVFEKGNFFPSFLLAAAAVLIPVFLLPTRHTTPFVYVPFFLSLHCSLFAGYD